MRSEWSRMGPNPLIGVLIRRGSFFFFFFFEKSTMNILFRFSAVIVEYIHNLNNPTEPSDHHRAPNMRQTLYIHNYSL